MFRLAMLFHIFIGSTLAGSAVIAALTMGFDSMGQVIWAAVIGFIVSIPVTYLVAKKIYELGQ